MGDRQLFGQKTLIYGPGPDLANGRLAVKRYQDIAQFVGMEALNRDKYGHHIREVERLLEEGHALWLDKITVNLTVITSQERKDRQ